MIDSDATYRYHLLATRISGALSLLAGLTVWLVGHHVVSWMLEDPFTAAAWGIASIFEGLGDMVGGDAASDTEDAELAELLDPFADKPPSARIISGFVMILIGVAFGFLPVAAGIFCGSCSWGPLYRFCLRTGAILELAPHTTNPDIAVAAGYQQLGRFFCPRCRYSNPGGGVAYHCPHCGWHSGAEPEDPDSDEVRSGREGTLDSNAEAARGHMNDRGPRDEAQRPRENSAGDGDPTVPAIAVIGMEGSGKTVLTTVLAKRMSSTNGQVFLNPKGVKTLKHVEHVWATLQRGEWPPSTPAGEMLELNWTLMKADEELECELRLVDVAGQDLRRLFEDELVQSQENLPETLLALADYCRSASVLLFLVNLADFIGEGDSEQRVSNEAALKAAIDHLVQSGGGRRVSLLFTQADLYQGILAEHGNSWLEVAARYLPYVFNAHLRCGEVAVDAVSAVRDTEVSVDQDGHPRRVPKSGFGSEGIDELVDLLVRQAGGTPSPEATTGRRPGTASSTARPATGVVPDAVVVACPSCTRRLRLRGMRKPAKVNCPACGQQFSYAPGNTATPGQPAEQSGS